MPYLGNEVAPLVQALEGKELKLDSDGDSSITADTDDQIDIRVGGSDQIKIATGEVAFNEASGDVDFRVESNGNANMLMVNAGDDRVGIGTNSPAEALEVSTTADADYGIKVANDDTQAFVKVQSGGTALYGGNTSVNFISGSGFATAMNIDANGHITKPLQPAFLVKKGSSANTNMTYGSNVDITFATETFDQNDDISSGVFTAPVTGRYHLGFNIRHESPNSSCAFHYFGIDTSNFEYIQLQDQPVTASSDYHGFNFSILADMDINDTAKVFYYQSGGNATSDVTGFDAHAQFYGYLVC
jgi:hypothetical protein